MITLLGALIGFLGSVFPEFFKLFQDRQDKKHELAILDKQIEFQKLNLSNQLEEIIVKSESAEMQTLYSTMHTNIDWVDALNGCVRPVLALAFFAVYMLAKLAILMMYIQYDAGFVADIWTQEDTCIFSAIIAFYFGSRHFLKLRAQR